MTKETGPVKRIPTQIVDILLINRLISADPKLGYSQAAEKVLEVEKKYRYFTPLNNYESSPGKILLKERDRIRAYNDLNLSSEEEKQKLEQLEIEFKQTKEKIISATGDDPDEVEENIETALWGVANNLSEVEKIMIEGPLIYGFEETKDQKISNDKILQFLKDTFGPQILRKAKVGSISKDDKWRIAVIPGSDKVNEIIAKGLANSANICNMVIAENMEDYIKAAMILEEVEEPEDLRHLYKLRADAGNIYGFANFSLGSLGIEKSSDFDYLADIDLKTEEDKMRAYTLGTIAHEVIHRYQPQLSLQMNEEYKKIIEEEINTMPERKKYVSDYVVKHHEIYESSDEAILNEDMAEAVRIYVINFSFLQKNYPRRLDFIEKNLSFVKKDTAVKIILS